MRRASLAALTMALLLQLLVAAQQVGPNINVLAGTDERTGDAFLQRQNEAVVAISTRNSDHLIVAMNDYRTVDFVDTAAEETNNGIIARLLGLDGKAKAAMERVRANTPPEAWIGLGFSRDRGHTWYTGLLPGYPQDPTFVGQSSPVYGDTAGSDPVLITGQNGRVYLIALTFNREGISRISGTRFTDRNNVEGGEPFYFEVTREIARGSVSSKGRFADKPSGAAYAGGSASVFSTGSVSTKKKHVVVVPGCERVYTAYTVFEGVDSSGNFRNNVYAAVSASCGESWSVPMKISGPYTVDGKNYPGTRNQGTSTAVDPDTGHVYVAWRTYEPNGFVYVRSTDGGLTWSAPAPLTSSAVYPYDQPLLTTLDGANAVTFRSNAYLSILVYDGTIAAVWQERVNAETGVPAANGVPRIVLTRGTPDENGNLVWSPRSAVDLKDPGVNGFKRCEPEIPPGGTTPQTVCRGTGAQVMPHITARQGQVAVAYYESREQPPNAQDQSGAPGGLAPSTGYISGMQRQVDARAAIVDPVSWTTVSSFQISRYPIDPTTGRIMENPNAPDPQLRRKVSYANYPMFRGGIASFIGDYLHGIPLRADGSNPGFRFVFTSNELVLPPADLDFTKYTKPQQGQDPSVVCNPGSRNATIMTSEVGTGLVLGSPGTFKQLLNGQGLPLQRAFAVYVENHTGFTRGFRLTFESYDSNLVRPSFEQFANTPTVDIEVLASSSVTRSVFLTALSDVHTASVTVRATEIPLGPPTHLNPAPVLSPTLTASLVLNGDPSNPFVGQGDGNPNLGNTESHTPQLGTPQLGTPQLGTPQLGTPQLGTPQLGTPQLSTPQLGTTGEADPTYTDVTIDVTNEGNTASGFNSLVALGTAPHLNATGHTFQVFVYRVHQSAVVSGCGVGKAQQDQIIYMTPQLGTPQLGTPQLGTPQLGTPQLGTPQLGTPQLGTPQLGTPQLATASFSVSPGDPTPDAHDGTEHQHQADDSVRLTLRVVHPPNENPATAHPDPQAEFLNPFAVAVQAQAADTDETEPSTAVYDPIGLLDPVTFVVTNTNDDGAGSLREAISAANASPGFDLIRFDIPGAGPHTISPTTPLPQITDPVSIDATSQPGYAGTPLIEVSGGQSGASSGLWLAAGSSVVRGFGIRGFPGDGIRITGAGGNLVQANHIGANPGREAPGNTGNGILVTASPRNLIGGTAAATRNIISGNVGEGVRIDGLPSRGNVIAGNYIGTSVDGLADVGNTNSGVYLRRAPANFVIGNVVSGNDGFAGVTICGHPPFCGGGADLGAPGDADGNVVQGNFIGTGPAGDGALGNGSGPGPGHGVSIDGASDTVVGGTAAGTANVIANSLGNGVAIFNPPAARNQIRGNSIYANGGLAIDLDTDGVTPNDPGDGDAGSNDRQNAPTIAAASIVSGTLSVSGTLNSTAQTAFDVDLYGSSTCDASGNGEGAVYLGSTTVTTDGTGNGTFSASFATGLAPGALITATATNPEGSTSEFSTCVSTGEIIIGEPVGAPSSDGLDDFVTVAHSASVSRSTFTTEAQVRIDDDAMSFRRPLVSKRPDLGNFEEVRLWNAETP